MAPQHGRQACKRAGKEWLRLALIVGAVLIAAEADARVGGGQGFGGGGGGYSGGGGHSGGGGGGDGVALILYLLIRLVFQYPAIGVPLVIVVLIIVAIESRRSQRQTARLSSYAPRPRPPRQRGLDALRVHDPGFSEPVLFELIQLVHRRALEAVGTDRWDPLGPFVSAGAQQQLRATLHSVQAISDVVHAGIGVDSARRQGPWEEIAVVLIGSRMELRNQEQVPTYFEERWTFRRAATATSLPPEDTLRLGCPSCGSAIDTDNMGACRYCGTAITKGQLQWQAIDVQTLVRHRDRPPEVGLSSGGDEPGARVAALVDKGLPAAFRSLGGRHPDFDHDAFVARAKHTFLCLQAAWSAGQWQDARPHVTDPLHETLRFYMDNYARHGLRNRIEQVHVERLAVVKIQTDAWYEAITVHVVASGLDWIASADGAVVGGNKTKKRRFAEYWTFLRASGTGGTSGDGAHCPSCGTPLDRVNAAGVCGYCDSHITTGRFDWVLSRIDQPGAYQG